MDLSFSGSRKQSSPEAVTTSLGHHRLPLVATKMPYGLIERKKSVEAESPKSDSSHCPTIMIDKVVIHKKRRRLSDLSIEKSPPGAESEAAKVSILPATKRVSPSSENNNTEANTEEIQSSNNTSPRSSNSSPKSSKRRKRELHLISLVQILPQLQTY